MSTRSSKTVYLLDSSVLIALASADHTHHNLVMHWITSNQIHFATCPITQGALMRAYFRDAENPVMTEAKRILGSITTHPDHQFIPDDIDYLAIDGRGIRGHQQVTDAYLAHLAEHHKLKLATLDSAQAALYPDVAELLKGNL